MIKKNFVIFEVSYNKKRLSLTNQNTELGVFNIPAFNSSTSQAQNVFFPGAKRERDFFFLKCFQKISEFERLGPSLFVCLFVSWACKNRA